MGDPVNYEFPGSRKLLPASLNTPIFSGCAILADRDGRMPEFPRNDWANRHEMIPVRKYGKGGERVGIRATAHDEAHVHAQTLQ